MKSNQYRESEGEEQMMTERIYLNNDWKFSETFDEAMLCREYDSENMQEIRIPHTVKETPLHYFDEQEYQMISGYRRLLQIPKEWEGKTLLLTIEGAAHSSEVFINEAKAGGHHCGYTAFTMDISKLVAYGESNVLTIKVDSREAQNIPPFGYVIDYMTYGGIYRDVYLEVKEPCYLKDVFVYTKQAEYYIDEGERRRCKKSQTISEITIENASDQLVLRQWMRRKGEDYRMIGERSLKKEGKRLLAGRTVKLPIQTGDVELWDIDNPALYEIKTELLDGECKLDEKIITYGYRKACFKKEGFYLNGRKLKLRGLNRHQSYPYVGYAMPEAMQKQDADILKLELGLNAVRTSHYPQSHYFLERCDELGLLVFTELPGWQHIGDETWKDQAVENVKDMVIQYRNHTSIVLWGVRINESVDDDAFYKRTNEEARKLDPSRPTGGVRCYKKSHLLEDVYTYNDFVHSGLNKGCDRKADVTSDINKSYLISEYMGHMYPTKAFDWEEHRLEHAIRHANVLEEVQKQQDIAGSFGWCMFDYNTHKDFGSGDRICYHGVMDMFRNPKLAAAVYACQQSDTPVLELSSSMDIGEHPGSNRGEAYIFTNADSVRMYKNDHFIKEYTSAHRTHTHLENGPMKIDDYIGDLLEKQEKMSHKQAEDVKAILNEVAKFGLYNMSKRTYLKAAKMMLMYHMTMDDAVALYNQYIGNWGGASTSYRFEAVKDGRVIKTVTKAPMKELHLKAEVSHTELTELHSYDVAAVRIKAVDEYGNVLPFFNEPVILKAEGEVEIIGPDVISLSGGMGGTYVKTRGKAGTGKLSISTVTKVKKQVSFTVNVK